MAKGTTFYEVWHDDAPMHVVACPTLEEAMKYRAALEHPDGQINKVTIADMPIRKMLCAVFNREGYAITSEEVMPPLPEPKDE